ncbi:MAG: hypothetical protein R3F60_16355 [bacterium]
MAHTVTEEITGRDPACRPRSASPRAARSAIPIGIPNQSALTRTGSRCSAASPPRIPSAASCPTPARSAYRSAAGFGIRLDAGTGGAGTVITGDYDSMIVKLTARALSFPEAVAKVDRSLREFRIRGVKTNIPFLENTLAHPVFRAARPRRASWRRPRSRVPAAAGPGHAPAARPRGQRRQRPARVRSSG